MAYPLPEGISYDEATFLDGLGVALRAVARSGLRPMEDVVVLGAGPIGALILRVARAYGARRVFCTEISERAMEIAQTVGANDVMDARGMDVVSAVMERTEGFGVDVVFNTVGSLESQQEELRMLAGGDGWVVLAVKSDELSFDATLISGERTITTTANSLYADFQLAIDLMASERVNVAPLITHRFPLEQGVKAFATALNREKTGAVKVIIQS